MKVTMTLTIDYNIGETDPSEAFPEIDTALQNVARKAAGYGLLTEGTEFEVEDWECQVDTTEG